MNIIQLYFSANGRIRRRDYWLGAVAMGIFGLTVEFAAHQLLTGHPASAFLTDLSGWLSFKPTPFNIFLWMFFVFMSWPGICLAAKRWHDRSRPGWLAGVLLAVAWVLSFVQIQYGPAPGGGSEGINWPVYSVAILVSFVLAIWKFVELGCLDGRSPNPYGPSPKGRGAQADVF